MLVIDKNKEVKSTVSKTETVELPTLSPAAYQWLCEESIKTGLSVPKLIEILAIRKCLKK